MCRRLGCFDITSKAPLAETLGLKRTWVSALALPVMIWLSLSCQQTVMSGALGVTGVMSSGFRVAGLRI